MKSHRHGRLSRKVLLALSLGALASGCGDAEVSGDVGMTPVDDVALSAATVVLNEVSSQDGDQIEFFNHGAERVDLSGWSYSDETRLPAHSFVFPAGTEIGPGEFLVMSREHAHDFGLGRDDAVVLSDRRRCGGGVLLADCPPADRDPESVKCQSRRIENAHLQKLDFCPVYTLPTKPQRSGKC